MPWNHMQVEMVAADRLLQPMIGPGDMTREQAHTQVQTILDRHPALAPIATTWRRGAKGDTVYAAPLIWCIYEHPAREDPRRAARAWLEDFAATMRTTGADVQVGQFRQ